MASPASRSRGREKKGEQVAWGWLREKGYGREQVSRAWVSVGGREVSGEVGWGVLPIYLHFHFGSQISYKGPGSKQNSFEISFDAVKILTWVALLQFYFIFFLSQKIYL